MAGIGLVFTSVSLIAFVMSSPAVAGETPPESPAPQAKESVGDIIVTAQKREQRLQDVGIAVTALGKTALASFGRQDIAALANVTPSVQTNQYSPTITVFNIRGVSQNDFADTQEAPIAFYNDEVYVSALGAISGQTFDLERIEILRGPQGTLFGRNATGGLVQVITAKPTSRLEGYGALTFGSYGQVATEAAISGPLSGRMRARLSATTNYHGGYVKNRIGPDRGGSRFYAGRAQIAADVGDTGLFSVKLEGMRNDQERSAGAFTHAATGVDADGLGFALPPDVDFWGTGPGKDAFGYRDADNDPFRESINHDGRFDRTYWSASARYEQDIGSANLVSITNYQKLRKRYDEDSDISPADSFTYSANQDLDQMSQELRLSGTESRLNWIVGAYGMKIKTRNSYVSDFSRSFGLLLEYGGTQTTESLAMFGQLEYQLSELVTLTGGARYSWDWKKFDFTNRQTDVVGGTTSIFRFDPRADGRAKQKFGDPSGKMQVDIRPKDGVLLYAAISRGTKSGGFGVQAIQPIDPATLSFDRERLTNYEAGLKLSLSEKRLIINGSAFHYDYQGYQAFTIVGISQFITNKPARVNGFELELFARPFNGLLIQSFLAHLDTKIKDISLPFGRIADRRMPQAPSWSLGGMLRYELAAGGGKLAMQTDWKYNSSQFLSAFNAPIDRESKYLIGNVRVSYAFGEGKGPEVAAFVYNVTDRAYRLTNIDLGGAFGVAQQTFARPRWFGASLRYDF
jgi:iron complex outermembrane recepter protein